jgi:hypothetical protein
MTPDGEPKAPPLFDAAGMMNYSRRRIDDLIDDRFESIEKAQQSTNTKLEQTNAKIDQLSGRLSIIAGGLAVLSVAVNILGPAIVDSLLRNRILP